MTNDIDVVASLKPRDARRFETEFSPAEFYVPPIEVMEDEIRRPSRGHFNLIHTSTALKADVYPASRDPLTEWALKARREIRTQRHVIWTAPPEYVVLLKLEYWRDGGSDKHVRDIRAMLRALGSDIDREMIATEARSRGVLDQWLAVVEATPTG